MTIRAIIARVLGWLAALRRPWASALDEPDEPARVSSTPPPPDPPAEEPEPDDVPTLTVDVVHVPHGFAYLRVGGELVLQRFATPAEALSRLGATAALHPSADQLERLRALPAELRADVEAAAALPQESAAP